MKLPLGTLGSNAMLLIITPLRHTFWQLVPLGLAVCFLQLTYSAGFFVTFGDLCGPHTGTIYSFSMLLSFAASIGGQFAIAGLAPNGTDEEYLIVFVLAAALGVTATAVYVLFGTSQRQFWADESLQREPKKNSRREVLKCHL